MSAHYLGSYLSISRQMTGRFTPVNNGGGSAMSTNDDAGRYEIRLQGHLGNRWADWFDELTLTTCSDGTTVIHGVVLDQSALHGLLQKVRDVGLPLVSVTRLDAGES